MLKDRHPASGLAILQHPFHLGAGVDDATGLLLADAQTSGGLLVAVAPEAVDAFVATALDKGALCAAVIGEIVAGKARVEVV